MPKPAYAPADIGPFWRVRVCLPGSFIHLASRTEPLIKSNPTAGGPKRQVEMDLIEGTEHGDNVGFIDWDAVIALTYRFAPEKPIDDDEPLAVEPEIKTPRRRRDNGLSSRIRAAKAITRDMRR
jgi:hypothetical protein